MRFSFDFSKTRVLGYLGSPDDDFVSARAGLTEHGANRSKGLMMLGATVHMDRGLNGGVEYDVC